MRLSPYAALLGCSLVFVSQASGDVYEAGLREPPRTLTATALTEELTREEEAQAERKVPLRMEAAAELVWAGFNLVTAIWLADYVSKNARLRDATILWFHVGARGAEGIAFILFAFNVLVDSTALNTVFLAFQVGVHTPFLWSIIQYTVNYDQPKEWRTTLSSIAPFTLIAAFLVVFTQSMVVDGWEVQVMLFFLCFEIPLVVWIMASSAYIVATCRQQCRNPQLRPYAVAFLVMQILAYIAHWRHVAVISEGIVETPAGMVVQKLVEGGLILGNMLLTVKMVQLQGFNEVGAPEGSAWDPIQVDGYDSLGEDYVRFMVSPERLWSFSFVFYFSAFVTAFLCFRFITDPDMTHNKILRMYETLHPCILLDYLPGTLFAQPLFNLQILLILAAMALCFLRHVIEGHVVRILIGACAMMIFILVGAAFNLVFTFNPESTSVISHSIPYMANMVAQVIMILSETACVLFVDDFTKHPVLTCYVVFVCGVALFIEEFMCATLMENMDMVSAPATESVSKLNKPLSEWSTWDLFAGPITVIALDFIFIQWYRVSPRAVEGIGFNLSVTNFRSKNLNVLAAEQQRLSLNVRISGFLQTAIVLAMTTFSLAQYTNVKRHGALDDFKTEMSHLPGGAFISVGWVLTLVPIFCYVLCSIFAEFMSSSSQVQRALVTISGILVILSALLVHGGTIPGVFKTYPSYMGPEWFEAAITLWIFVDWLALSQNWRHLPTGKVMVEFTLAILAVVALIWDIFSPSKANTLIACGLVLVWSLVDCKQPRIVMDNFGLHQINSAELLFGLWPPVKVLDKSRTMNASPVAERP